MASSLSLLLAALALVACGYYYYPLSNDHVADEDTPSVSSRRSTLQVRQLNFADPKSVEPSIRAANDLPIYLLGIIDGITPHQTNWGTLSTAWNRDTTYDELFSRSLMVSSLPHAPSPLARYADSSGSYYYKRPVIIFNLGPKLGSTSITRACRDNYLATCGITFPGRRLPFAYDGLTQSAQLLELIRQCPQTSHFCWKNATMPSLHELPPMEDVQLIHMFPFRPYDEWANSAMKFQWTTRRCDVLYEGLERCQTYPRSEIVFEKYSKAQLSKFKDGVIQRIMSSNSNSIISEDHVFVLYDTNRWKESIKEVNKAYGLPDLPVPGLNRHKKGDYCERHGEMLDRYHDCFSDGLMDL